MCSSSPRYPGVESPTSSSRWEELSIHSVLTAMIRHSISIWFLLRSQRPGSTTDTVGRSSVTNLCSSCRCTSLRKTGGPASVPNTRRHTPLLLALTPLVPAARSVDVLELSEQRELLKFHHHTLRLYSAICALGNNRVAHALCSHVDESQLLQAIENKYMPGNWREETRF